MNFLDRMFIKRFLKLAYHAHAETGLELARPVYDKADPYRALTQLMRDIIDQLSAIPDAATRQRVFYDGMENAMIRLLGGKFSVALMAKFMRWAPNLGARLMNALTPVAFQWLVGPIVRHGKHDSQIPFCWFRKALGETACVELCQKPTQFFFADSLQLPLRLIPSSDGESCSITYGSGQT